MKYLVYLSKLMFLIITFIFMQFKKKYLLIFSAYYFMYSLNITK